MRTLLIGVVVLVLPYGACFAAVEPINNGADGYCVITRNGDPNVTKPADYTFDNQGGEIYLKTVGAWELTYQSTATPGDPGAVPTNVKRIRYNVANPNGDFALHVVGEDLENWVYYFDFPAGGARSLQLDLVGSIVTGGWVDAPTFTVTNSTIAGNAAGYNGVAMEVAAIENDASSGVGLDITGTLTKKIRVRNDLNGTINLGDLDGTGTLQIDGACPGVIHVANTLAGNVSLGGDLSGTIHAGNWIASDDTAKQVFIDGDITLTGHLDIPGDFDHWLVADNVDSLIEVKGSFLGGAMYFDGDLSQELRIYGGLANDSLQTHEITVTGTLGEFAAIIVDWDGYDSSDNWESGAQVQVGSGSAYGYLNPWTSGRVSRVTCFKGDMNNDGGTNNQDIDGFVDALFDASAYAAAFIGLSGSMVYHADFSGDGYVNNQDIDGFTYCLFNNCPCPGGGRSQGGDEEWTAPADPGDVAGAFQAYASPDRLSVLAVGIADLADEYTGTARGEFWSAVLTALEQ